jgi:hypothetical protein
MGNYTSAEATGEDTSRDTKRQFPTASSCRHVRPLANGGDYILHSASARQGSLATHLECLDSRAKGTIS